MSQLYSIHHVHMYVGHYFREKHCVKFTENVMASKVRREKHARVEEDDVITELKWFVGGFCNWPNTYE